MDYYFDCECKDEYGENCGRTVILYMCAQRVKMIDHELGIDCSFDPEQVEMSPNGVVSFGDSEYTMYIPSACFRQHLKIIGGKVVGDSVYAGAAID